MTKEDVIRMSREAGIQIAADSNVVGFYGCMERFAAFVAAAEREACAQIVEREASQYAEPTWALEIVNDIRARSEA